ncbi:Sodium:neurotransmitter symporter family protein [Dictyocaulus viviparus]|uniref:Sodium:neurotransmitter symporter family protein n=1 Tax=Dictyocaulus viviparus TaxID=29172 RepID=A0A0D8YFI0_DICVI|nr:Sodium:neurotransmitter symporter family protein [Dictyocaulus viviparus]
MKKTSDTEEISSSKRGFWDNETEYHLSVLGLTVGLGSVWRFPTLAYKNGGSAFLIPYIICAVFVGLPMLYLEMVVSQYTNAGPSMIFKHYIPAFQGIGWTMATTSITIAIYYCVVVAWAGVYFVLYMSGRHKQLIKCDNEWNDIFCIDEYETGRCRKFNALLPIHFNGTCISDTNEVVKRLMSPFNQYFMNVTTKRSSNIDDFGEINWMTLVSIIFLYMINFIILIEGYKYLGKIGYVTTTAPYLILTILFTRAVTFEGAVNGILHFLGKPNLEIMFKRETWIEALVQICYSMEVGYGGILTLASYNYKNNNCYKSAWIVVFGNILMSGLAGITVFATLGYLSHHSGKPLEKVVSDGLPLVFVAYPEAIARMPYSKIWGMLFFAMLFILGICECFFTCIYDRFPRTRKCKWFIVACFSLTLFLLSIPFATESGFYWFTIYDMFCGTAAASFNITLELILFIYVYGYRNICDDLVEMLGEPQRGWRSLFGPHSLLWMISWRFLTPIITAAVFMMTFYRERLTLETSTGAHEFPAWALNFAWFLSLSPIAAIPFIFVGNALEFRRKRRPLVELFMIQPSLPSYNRIMGIGDKGNNEEQSRSNDITNIDESSSTRRDTSNGDEQLVHFS